MHGADHAQRLEKQRAAERLGQDEHAVRLHQLGNGVCLLGFDEQKHTGGCFVRGGLRQLMAELVGQGRVDENNVEYPVQQGAPCLLYTSRCV